MSISHWSAVRLGVFLLVQHRWLPGISHFRYRDNVTLTHTLVGELLYYRDKVPGLDNTIIIRQ